MPTIPKSEGFDIRLASCAGVSIAELIGWLLRKTLKVVGFAIIGVRDGFARRLESAAEFVASMALNEKLAANAASCEGLETMLVSDGLASIPPSMNALPVMLMSDGLVCEGIHLLGVCGKASEGGVCEDSQILTADHLMQLLISGAL